MTLPKTISPAGAVVEVHALAPHRSRAADVVNEVVSDHVAADRPIAAGVEDAHVTRLLANVVDFVQFHHVFVAAEADGPVRGVVDELWAARLPTPWRCIAAGVRPLQPPEVVDMVVVA